VLPSSHRGFVGDPWASFKKGRGGGWRRGELIIEKKKGKGEKRTTPELGLFNPNHPIQTQNGRF